MSAALKLDPRRAHTAEDRLAMLRALPLAPEPPTEEERALFEKLEADVRSGRRGGAKGTEEVLATIEQARRDSRE